MTEFCSDDLHIKRYCPDEGVPVCGKTLFIFTGVYHRGDETCARRDEHEGGCAPWVSREEVEKNGWQE